jgi:dihydrodipicolinate synthase/N-acetylneuraminate lyase
MLIDHHTVTLLLAHAGLKYTMRDLYLFERLADLAPMVLGRRLNMLSGADECQVMGMAAGSDGAIGTFYNMMPKTFVALRAAFNRGDTAEALRMQTRGNRVIALALDGGVGKLSVLASMRHYMREAQGIAAAGYSKKVTRGDVYTDLIHGAAFTTAVQQLGFPIE